MPRSWKAKQKPLRPLQKLAPRQKKPLRRASTPRKHCGWLDALTDTQRNQDRLDASRKSSDQLAEGLTPGYARRIKDYNDQQYKRRLATLK
jgi:hypothetical protein